MKVKDLRWDIQEILYYKHGIFSTKERSYKTIEGKQ